MGQWKSSILSDTTVALYPHCGCIQIAMPRKGIHPMVHLTRVVLTNGASILQPMAWQRPGPGLQITTKFLDEDYLTHEDFTGVQGKSKRKVGRRAKFENRFGEKKEEE